MVGVLEVEVERHLEVELHGAALPGASERIFQMEVDLRAVEGAVALVDHRKADLSLSRAAFKSALAAAAQSSSEPMQSSGRVESSTWYLKPNFWYTSNR